MAEKTTPQADQITDELKPSIKTTNGKILLVAVLLGPIWAIGIFWLAGTVLSPEDAQIIKAPIAAILGVAGSTGLIGMGIRSLMTSNGKIAAQVAQVTQCTPEDLSAPGDDDAVAARAAQAQAVIEQEAQYANDTP